LRAWGLKSPCTDDVIDDADGEFWVNEGLLAIHSELPRSLSRHTAWTSLAGSHTMPSVGLLVGGLTGR